MSAKGMLRDTVVSSAAALLATRVMDPVTTALQRAQSDESRRREQEVSPGLASEVAARKTAQAVGVELDERQAKLAGSLYHYGLAMSWAPLYALLRRTTRLVPWRAGLAAGLAMFVLADEILNSLFRVSAPPRAYPLATHLRGLVGHVVYGLAVAAGAEAGWKLLGARPGQPRRLRS